MAQESDREPFLALDENSGMRDFRKLIVWQRSHGLALEAHRALHSARAPGAASARNQLVVRARTGEDSAPKDHELQGRALREKAKGGRPES